MRTLALTAALATALTGTGCIVTTNDRSGDLDLAWRFQNSDGQVAGTFTAGNSGCGVAAITEVDVSVYDGFGDRLVFQTFPCQEQGTGLPRAFVAGLPAGSYSYLATAYRVDAPVFEDGGTFFVSDNATTPVDATLAVVTPAPLSVYFTQGGVATCAGTPSIRFDLYNGAGTTLLETTTVPCDPVSTGFTATLDRSTGVSYQLDIFALDGLGQSVSERCLQTVRHTGFPVTIDLLPAPQAACGP